MAIQNGLQEAQLIEGRCWGGLATPPQAGPLALQFFSLAAGNRHFL
jgi:hypothetical protein